MTRTDKWNLRVGLCFISPWIIGFGFFFSLPCILSLYFSFCNYNVLNKPVFIGVTNYTRLFSDEVFWISLYNTLFFAAVALPVGTILSLGLALLLNANIIGRSIWRTVFFLPSLVPLVALAILWQWLLNAEYGLVNIFLGWFGIPPVDWLGDVRFSKFALVLTGLWATGHAVVIYLAGLQDVPRSLYEASTIDGANPLQQIFHVTLPMISPVIYFNVIMGVIGVLQVFALPYVMTEGGPARSTLFYTMYLFDQAFVYLNMGYASAMAWVLFGIIAVLTFAADRFSKGKVHYGSGN